MTSTEFKKSYFAYFYSAKETGKNIRDYLKDEGHKELLLRYDLDQKEKEQPKGEQEKEPSPRKLRSKDPKPEVSNS